MQTPLPGAQTVRNLSLSEAWSSASNAGGRRSPP